MMVIPPPNVTGKLHLGTLLNLNSPFLSLCEIPSKQTCTTPQVFVTLYELVCTWFKYLHNLVSYDDFFGEEKFSWLPSKNKVVVENLHFQRHKIFLVKFNFQFFYQPLCFQKAASFIIFFLKNCQMKAGQHNKI